MSVQLNEVEARVLGVLIEKSLTQQSSYPMTLNSLVLGANQKQNRDPVLALTEKEVGKALYEMEQRRLVKQAPPSAGARANRFDHLVVETLHWDRREQAVMAELMLRGAQTTGELRTRGSRITPLQDLESVVQVLNTLKAVDPPFVEELPREPGRSANRWRHLLSGDSDAAAIPAVEAAAEKSTETATESSTTLAERVAALESRVASLEESIENLRTNRSDSVDPG